MRRVPRPLASPRCRQLERLELRRLLAIDVTSITGTPPTVELSGDQPLAVSNDLLTLSVDNNQVAHNLLADAQAGAGDYADRLDFDPSSDTQALDLDGFAAINIDLGAGTNTVRIQSPQLLTQPINIVDATGNGTDRLIGPGANTPWTVGLPNGNAGLLGTAVVFDGVEFLIGGSADDLFQITPAQQSHAIRIDGGAGSDQLNYSSVPTSISVDLQEGRGTLLGNGFNNIENVIGTDAADEIRGNASDNVLEGGDSADFLADGAGSDVLVGGLGDDTYAWTLGGLDEFVDTGGIDTFDFSESPVGVNVIWTVDQVQLETAAGDQLSGTGSIENLVGSRHGDSLLIDAGVQVVTVTEGGEQLMVGNQPLSISSWESVRVRNATEVIVRGDATANVLQLWGGIADNQLRLQLDNGQTFSYTDASVRFEGLGGSDLLRIIEDNATGLPNLVGSPAGARANSAFLAAGGSAADLGIHFDAGEGSDAIQISLTSALDVSYFADAIGNGNSGVVQIVTELNVTELALSFEGLAPLVLTGGGGMLTVDASATPATTDVMVADDTAEIAGPGSNVITGDGGLETVFFSGFVGTTVRSGDGSETIRLLNLDPSPSAAGVRLEQIQLSGDNITGTDISGDTLVVESLPLTIAGTLLGGAGADLFEIGFAPGGLSAVRGNISVDGGIPSASLAPAAPARQVTAGDTARPDPALQLETGDTLRLHDEVSLDEHSYEVTALTVARDGMGTIGYAEIETLELSTTINSANIIVASTAAGTATRITTGPSNDSVTVSDFGDGGLLRIDTQAGGDQVTMINGGDDGLASFDMGAGDDVVVVQSTGAGSGTEVFGSTGRDSLSILQTGSQSTLLGDGGADTDLLVLVAAGGDSVVELIGGEAADQIELRTLPLTSHALLAGGEGRDEIAIGGAALGFNAVLETSPLMAASLWLESTMPPHPASDRRRLNTARPGNRSGNR